MLFFPSSIAMDTLQGRELKLNFLLEFPYQVFWPLIDTKLSKMRKIKKKFFFLLRVKLISEVELELVSTNFCVSD